MAERLTKADEFLLLDDRKGFLKFVLKRIRYIRTYATRTLQTLDAMDAQWPNSGKEERDEVRKVNQNTIAWANAQEKTLINELESFSD